MKYYKPKEKKKKDNLITCCLDCPYFEMFDTNSFLFIGSGNCKLAGKTWDPAIRLQPGWCPLPEEK